MARLEPLVEAMFRRIDHARGPGSDMAAHMSTLYTLARLYSFGRIVECGTHQGFSTHAILCGVVETGGHLTSYDRQPMCGEWAARNMGLVENDPRRKFWDFVTKDCVDAAKDWKDGDVSMLFLDTSHAYGATKLELAAWLPKIHPEGIMCGHDYYLHLSPGWETASGVNRAVDEFASEHADRFRLQVLPHDQGLFVLWPKG